MEAYIVHLATGIRIFGQSYIVIKVIYWPFKFKTI
jgi:hypothetical protein